MEVVVLDNITGDNPQTKSLVYEIGHLNIDSANPTFARESKDL